MPHPVGGAMGVTLALYHCRAARETRFDIILFNIHKTTSRWQSPGCCTLTSTADFAAWQGTQPTVLQLFLRYSVEIYKCANASQLISWCKTWQESMWVA